MNRKNFSGNCLPKIICIVLLCSCLSSCNNSKSDFSEKDITITIEDKNRPNYFTVNSLISGDKYDKLEWILPSGEKVSELTSQTIYLPQKGKYSLKTKLTKDNKTIEVVKNIVVDKTDPYVDNNEELIWSDEFNGSKINLEWWTNETNVRVNDEWQEYSNGENISLNNGKLTIEARLSGKGQQLGDYTSGRLKTQGKKEFMYGRMEIRAMLPNGKGTWPAIWMLGRDIDDLDWPACGEIDIMEHVGFNPTIVHSTLHSNSSYGNTVNTKTTKVDTYDTQYHIYGMNWTPEKMDFYIDTPENIHYTYNPKIKNKETWPFDKKFFFILNLAVGGHWGGKEGVDDSIFPKSMLVDYVRVYQKK